MEISVGNSFSLTFDLDENPLGLATSSELSLKGMGSHFTNEWSASVIFFENLNLISTEINQILGQNAPLTLFIRADKHVSKSLGSKFYFFENYLSQMADLQSQGHEIGLHLHLDKFDWEDQHLIKQDLFRLKGLVSNGGVDLSGIRFGGHNLVEEFVPVLEELGFLYDSTMMPGRSRQDDMFQFDWQDAETTIHPITSQDWGKKYGKIYNLIEIPFPMFDIRAPYDNPRENIKRYFDINFSHSCLAHINDDIRSFNMAIAHPHSMLVEQERNSEMLLLPGWENFRKNLKLIKSMFPLHNFVTLKTVVEGFA